MPRYPRREALRYRCPLRPGTIGSSFRSRTRLAEGLTAGCEEHDVVGHQGQDGVDVAGLGCPPPGVEQATDLALLVVHGHLLADDLEPASPCAYPQPGSS